jgi:hypothetical protein
MSGKKWAIGVGVVVALAGGYLGAAHLSGGNLPTLGLPIGGDEAKLRSTALSFWEDIQFKDFDHAASYHAPELQDAVDIPYLLQRLFKVKPEALDLMEYEVVFVDIDSSRLRARVKTRLKVKFLGNGKIKEQEVLLYFHRDDVDSPWFMKLEDSLRGAQADPDKEH